MTTAMTTTEPGAPIEKHGKQKTTLKDWLEGQKHRLESVAMAHMRPEEMIRLALLAGSRQPKILECSPESILKALMDSAALGIRPGGLNGRGYLVPRSNRKNGKTECCFDPGYRGLLDIARRSRQLKTIDVHVVREKDAFDVEYGTSPHITHKPYMGNDDAGAIVASYAIAGLLDGAQQIEVLTRHDLKKIRKCSMASSGPWSDWEDEMSRKSAVRRIVKYLPVEPEISEAMDRALALSDAAEGNTASPQRQLTSLGEALASPTTETPEEIDGEIVDSDGRQPGED